MIERSIGSKNYATGYSAMVTTKNRKPKKIIPHNFVLDLLSPLQPYTKPMFGCTAVYVDEKIIFILRQKSDYRRDNGVWLATQAEHHAELRKKFTEMRSIECLANGAPTNWQILPEDSPLFEESVTLACEMVLNGDPKIGKVPKRKIKSSKKKAIGKKK